MPNYWQKWRKMMKLRFLGISIVGILLAALTGCSNEKVDAPLIELTDFFKNPEKVGYKISPNGKHLAFLESFNSRMNIFVQESVTDSAIRITDSNDDIKAFFWGNDSIICYLKETDKKRNYHLYKINRKGSSQLNLTPYQNSTVEIIDFLPRIENEILVKINLEDLKIFDLYKINIQDETVELVEKNSGNVTWWLADHEGNVRLKISTDGVNEVIEYRSNANSRYRPIAANNFKDVFMPDLFSYDNKYLYVRSNIGRDKIAVVKFDPETMEEIKVIYENPEVDVHKILRSDITEQIIGVYYLDFKGTYHFFDDDHAKLFSVLQNKLPGYEIDFAGSSKDETKLVIRTFSDRSLGAYYLYDTDKTELVKLAEISPWLNEEQLAPMKSVSYKSRDGLTIKGYLTLPKVGKLENLPAVILPNPGAWRRYIWGFNADAQFFANRGYVVLQLNHRGAYGYGKDYWAAGFKQWGQNMQNDIEDGTRWLIRQNIADSSRIAISGYSYGGYAALMGLIKSPELYACGIDHSGIVNLFHFLNTIPPSWEPFREMLYEMVGNPETDSLMLYQNSPLFNSDKIQSPVLIAQGGNDTKVLQEDIDSILSTLEKNNIEYKYVFNKDEGHGFGKEENRIELYKEIEKFLSKHLKGRLKN